MVRVVKSNGCVGFHDICWKTGVPDWMKKRLDEIEHETPETLEGWKALCEKVGLTDVRAIDRSHIIPGWMKETTGKLGVGKIIKIILPVIRGWGIPGLMDVWESERIFRSKFTGYGLFVGTKPLVE